MKSYWMRHFRGCCNIVETHTHTHVTTHDVNSALMCQAATGLNDMTHLFIFTDEKSPYAQPLRIITYTGPTEFEDLS